MKFENLTTGLGVVTDGLPEDELNRKIVGQYFSCHRPFSKSLLKQEKVV